MRKFRYRKAVETELEIAKNALKTCPEYLKETLEQAIKAMEEYLNDVD